MLYQLARAQEQGGELEVGAEDARPAGRRATPTRRTATRPSSAAASCCSRLRDYAQRRAGLRHRAGQRERTTRSTTARCTCRAGRCSSRAGSRRRCSSFFGVLDLKVAGRDGDGELDSARRPERAPTANWSKTPSASPASAWPTCRAPSRSRPTSPTTARRAYEFRVYEQLGELYLKQERIKDAADTFGAFARRQPLHAQAPLLQARVIEIYQGNGFADAGARREEGLRRRATASSSEFRRANPAGWERAQPLVKTHLAELARHYHASAQKSKATRRLPGGGALVPRLHRRRSRTTPRRRRTTSCSPSCCSRTSRFGEAAVEYEKVAYELPEPRQERRRRLRRAAGYAGQEKRAAGGRAARRCSAPASTARCASPQAFPADPRAGTGADQRRREALRAARRRARRSAWRSRCWRCTRRPRPAQRRVAWTVIAHTAFERGALRPRPRRPTPRCWR